MHRFSDLPQSEALDAAVTSIFSERVTTKAAPGTVFAIFDRSGIVIETGLGEAWTEGGAPGSDTRFRIASCTKSFTAAAVLILRDRGLLTLDDRITQYVPPLCPTLPTSQPEAPTLRMLLSMSGGFPTDDPWADRQESLTNAEFDAVLANGVRFASAPGTRYEYSNLGYALLGRVIEIVSGLTYPEFLAENLFGPLGLNETGLDPAKVSPDMMATGFRKTEAGWEAVPFSGPGAFSAIGGIVTTARDLARWGGWLNDAFFPTDADDSPLSSASRREMQRIHCPIEPEPTETFKLKGYGYGLVVEHHERYGSIVSHSGGYPGFSSHMRWSVDTGLGVIAFENATYSGARGPAMAALDCLLKVSHDSRELTNEIPPAVEQLAKGLRCLALEGWSDTIANEIFLDNVTLDKPYAERARELTELVERAGPIDASSMTLSPCDTGGGENGYGRFQLRLDAACGQILFQVQCGPLTPLKIQSITFEFK